LDEKIKPAMDKAELCAEAFKNCCKDGRSDSKILGFKKKLVNYLQLLRNR
jgi:hypothetical protein